MRSPNAPDLLFVDDNPFDVELTLRKLNASGLQNRVKVVRDGKEALDYLFRAGAYGGRSVEDAPRLVLLDLKLPKVTGLQVLQWIRAEPLTKDLPVIILTSFEDDREVVELFRLGVAAYLVKPLNIDEFCERAQGFIEGIRPPPGKQAPPPRVPPGAAWQDAPPMP